METTTKRQIEYADGRKTAEFTKDYIERRVKEDSESYYREIRMNLNLGTNEDLKIYYAELRKKLNIKTK